MIFLMCGAVACTSNGGNTNTQNSSTVQQQEEEMLEYQKKMDGGLRREIRRQQRLELSEPVSVLVTAVAGKADELAEEFSQTEVDIRTITGNILTVRAVPELIIKMAQNEKTERLEISVTRSR